MQELRVVTRMVPPLVIIQHGELTGFSIELWNKLAERMQVRARYHVAPDVGALLEEVRSGKQISALRRLPSLRSARNSSIFSEPILNRRAANHGAQPSSSK